MASRTSEPGRWAAIALVAIATLVLTNAGWYYRWQVREADHVEQLNAMITSTPASEPRIVYENEDSRMVPVSWEQPRRGSRVLLTGEECRGGVVIKRTSEGLESTGERCRSQ